MMEENLAATLRGTLAVPSVQELAKDSPEKVPARYLRYDQDFSPIKSSTCISFTDNIPIINMESLLLGDEIELKKLDSACKDWGFFQLINHGVSSSVVEKMKSEIQKFFNLPLEEKAKFEQLPGDTDGFGQLFVVSDEQKLDWADMFSKLSLSFRETIEAYSEEVKELAMKVLKLLGKALGIEAEEVNNLFEKGMQSMRMNYYPPCPQPELVMGFCPHSDACALTILLQVNETDGLQIRKDGIWIPVLPLPNAFIVNVGDSLEIFSNGIYRSIEHRSVVSAVKERISIATFHSPKLNGELGPATSLITADTPPIFKNINVHEYFRGYFTRKLDGKSYVDTMRITSENDL